LPVAFGEIFVKGVYQALTSNPARWAKTVLALCYDEHGGFFDHVPPLRVPTDAPPGATYQMGPFASTGPRVPALLISPYAPRQTAAHGLYDHTSLLQMLADRFGAGGAPYSAAVEARRQAPEPIGSITEALSAEARDDVPRIPDAPIAGTAALVSVRPPRTEGQRSFASGATAFAAARGQDALQKYPQIAHLLATSGPAAAADPDQH
jgi:phospholipase C